MTRAVIPFRGVAADALSAVASVLGITSRVASQGAELLRGEPEPPPRSEPMPWDRPAPRSPYDEPPAYDDTPPGPLGPVDVDEEELDDGVVVEDLADTEADVVEDLIPPVAPEPAAEPVRAVGAVEQPPVAPQPVFDDAARVRSPDTHAAELAARPAAEVVAAVDGLSTDELRALYEEESSGKKRKTVLAAVERALSP